MKRQRPLEYKRTRPTLIESFNWGHHFGMRYEYYLPNGYVLSALYTYAIDPDKYTLDELLNDSFSEVEANISCEIAIKNVWEYENVLSQIFYDEWGDSVYYVDDHNELKSYLDKTYKYAIGLYDRHSNISFLMLPEELINVLKEHYIRTVIPKDLKPLFDNKIYTKSQRIIYNHLLNKLNEGEY